MADPTSTAEKSTESNGTPVEEWPPVVSTTMEAHRRQQRADDYITGWPLYIILGATWLSLFVSQMESSIASTAILTVTNELGGYSKSSWIFTAYMLTYSGFPIIWGKVSDIFGRKTCLLTALLVFVVFSAACGAAQTITQLIMFRWLQGIGGSGIYSIATLVQWELLPPEKWATNTSFVTGIIALSLVAGPLIGGGITQGGSWRWIFLINCPIIPVAATLLLWKFPRRLSNEHAAIYASESLASRLSLKHLRRIDVIGGFLLLACCLLISTGLQEAAEGRSWTSAVVLALIIVGGMSIPIFLLWQWYVTAKLPYPEPVFPWRFVQSRIFIGMIMNAFLAGIVLSVCIVQLPQRFMTVNGLSPLAAGARLLPFGAFAPVGASISAGLMDKARIPPVYICVVGMILEIIGLVFLSRASGDRHINASQYGFQIITAVGNGYLQTASVLLIPYIVQNRDLAVSNATMAQFRILGGAIGISIATAASQPFVQNRLLRILPANAVLTILGRTGGIESLPDAMQNTVRSTFADGYNLQMKILIGIASAHAIPILLMWTRKPMVISRKAAQHDSRTDSVSV